MIVRILLFALAKQRAGRDSVEVELPAGATVRQLREALAKQFPHPCRSVAARAICRE